MEFTDPGLDALRDEFHDAEAICYALSGGEIDAVVVGRSNEERRVLLLSGAYTRYRQLVEDMLQGAVTVSVAGEILFANHAFADMTGVPLLDLSRAPLQKFISPADQDKLEHLLYPSVGQRDIEMSLVRPDGTRAHVRAGVVSSSDDFVTLILTSALRERDDAEATLDAIQQGRVDAFVVGDERVVLLDSAQAHYRTLVERMRQGAVTVTSGGIVAYANERFISAIGMPHGHIVGQALAEMIAEGDRAAFRAMLGAGENAHGELRLRCANGERPIMLATMTALDGHKLFLFTDLTEQKRHEASDERTRRFLGMLAHEFRNILAPISSATQLLKVKAADPDSLKAAEVIERQTSRLLALVDDLRRVNPKE
jgi:PAS domain S-box-containing protein